MNDDYVDHNLKLFMKDWLQYWKCMYNNYILYESKR